MNLILRSIEITLIYFFYFEIRRFQKVLGRAKVGRKFTMEKMAFMKHKIFIHKKYSKNDSPFQPPSGPKDKGL